MSSSTSATTTNESKLNLGTFPTLGAAAAVKQKNNARGKKGAQSAEAQSPEPIPFEVYSEMHATLSQEVANLKAELTLANKTIAQLSTPSTREGTSHTALVAQLTDAQAQILTTKNESETAKAELAAISAELAAARNDLVAAQSSSAIKESALAKLADELTKAKVAKNLDAPEEDPTALPTENPPGVTGITRITMNPPYLRALDLVKKVEAFVVSTAELVAIATPLFDKSPIYFQADDTVGKGMVKDLGFACDVLNNTETRLVTENGLYERFTKACAAYNSDILTMVDAVNKELNILYDYKLKQAEITTPMTPEMRRVYIMKMLCPADEIKKRDELHDLAFKNCMSVAERLYKGMKQIDTNMGGIRHMINHVWDRSAGTVFKEDANKKPKVAVFVPKIKLDARVSF